MKQKGQKPDVNPLVIVLFAEIVIGFYGIYKIYKGYESQNWPTTEGKIIDSRLSGAKRIIGRRIFIKYEYSVDGNRYVSSQISYTRYIYLNPVRAGSLSEPPVRTRMLCGVGRGGGKPPLTRLGLILSITFQYLK